MSMRCLQTNYLLAMYLQPSSMIDFDHPEIQEHIASLQPQGRSEVEIVRDAFEFVRDAIAHSSDIGSHVVTAKASEVLRLREGICYAKSHLLAALLRGMGIPAGVCYQKLLFGETPESGYVVHGLNTVYLSSTNRWIRLDARGNKPGLDAQFSIAEERLAYAPRQELGEVDYLLNFPEPHPEIVRTLETHDDCVEMCLHHLPTDLEQP